jgi:hypothetical protein
MEQPTAAELRAFLVATAVAAVRARSSAPRAAPEGAPLPPDLDLTPPIAATTDEQVLAEPALAAQQQTSRIIFELPGVELPALREPSESPLEYCVGRLRTGPDWPVRVAERIDAAVREAARKAECEHSSERLISVMLAVVHALTDGSGERDMNGHTTQQGYTSLMACQAIIEACIHHTPTALVALEACVDVAVEIVHSLERDLALGSALVLDDARARALLSSAHIFQALESVTMLLRKGGEALDGRPSTRKLLALEQAIRDSEFQFDVHFPLIAGSITQCAWIALDGDASPLAG